MNHRELHVESWLGFQEQLRNYFKTTAIVNNYLTKYNIKEKIRTWTNTRMNFSDFKISNRLE